MAKTDERDEQVISGGDVEVIDKSLVRMGSQIEEVGNEAARQFIQEASAQVIDDAQAASLAIMNNILTATTVDDILTPPTVTHSDEVFRTPFELQDVRWNKSSYDKGPGFYGLLIGKFLANGDPCTISCSAQSVMAQAYAIKQKGFLPVAVMIVPADKPTADGYVPLHLEKALEPFK